MWLWHIWPYLRGFIWLNAHHIMPTMGLVTSQHGWPPGLLLRSHITFSSTERKQFWEHVQIWLHYISSTEGKQFWEHVQIWLHYISSTEENTFWEHVQIWLPVLVKKWYASLCSSLMNITINYHVQPKHNASLLQFMSKMRKHFLCMISYINGGVILSISYIFLFSFFSDY